MTTQKPPTRRLSYRLTPFLEHLIPRAWLLRLRVRRRNKQFRKLLKDAKTDLERNEISREWNDDFDDLELQQLIDKRLIRKARRLLVEVPTHPWNQDAGDTEDWETSYLTREWTLTIEGRRRIGLGIRASKKERRDAIVAWAQILGPILTALTGVLGTLIGLFTILGKR